MKLFAFDVDGTLVGDFKTLDKETIGALNDLLDKGNVVAIASGRPYPGVYKWLSLLHDGKKYCICANGTIVQDYNGKVLDMNSIPLKEYYTFIKRYKSVFENPDMNIYIYTSDSIGYLKYNNWIKWEIAANGNFKGLDLTKANLSDDFPILKFMIASDEKSSLEIEKNLDKEEYNKFNIMRTSPYFIEFINKNADKATGVEFLKNYLNIKAEDVYTFGDSGNDVGMIKRFNGVAMGNANDECKQYAKFITKSCKDLGVVYAVKHYCKY